MIHTYDQMNLFSLWALIILITIDKILTLIEKHTLGTL